MGDTTEKELLQLISRYSNEQFDKNILFISSGGLGISFAFIKDVIPDLNLASCKGLLLCSWYFFGFVILTSLVAQFVSARAASIANESQNLDDDSYNRKLKPYNLSIRTMNIACIVGIFFGVGALILFIQQNL